MSDQLPQHLDDSFEWKEYTSKNGKPYKVGVKKTEHAAEEDEAAIKSEAALKEGLDTGDVSPSAVVRWEVGGDTWKETSAEVKNLGVSRYRLLWTDVPLAEYLLWFTNTKGWKFAFVDEEGDAYEVLTSLNRDHAFTYSSNKPTIVGLYRIL